MIFKGIPYLQTILTLLLCGTAFTARAQADSAEPADSCYPEIICPDSNRLGGNVAALEPLFQKLEALEKKDTTAVILDPANRRFAYPGRFSPTKCVKTSNANSGKRGAA